jgi:hypothetical protein
VSIQKTHEQHQKSSYTSSKKKRNKPLAAFPPSARLKEHQTKHNSLILTERLQYKKSLGRIFGAATPPGALASFASHEFESRADDGDKYSTAHKALKQYTVQRLDSLAAGDAIDRSLN